MGDGGEVGGIRITGGGVRGVRVGWFDGAPGVEGVVGLWKYVTVGFFEGSKETRVGDTELGTELGYLWAEGK